MIDVEKTLAEHGERLATNETKILRVEEKVSNIENKNEDINDIKLSLAVLTQIQKENSDRWERQEKHDEKFENTLTNINENLTTMNTELKNTNKDVEELKELKNKFDASEEIYKIDIRTTIKNFLSDNWAKILLAGLSIYMALIKLKILK